MLNAIDENHKKGIVTNCTETHFLYGKVFCAACGAPYTRRTFTDRKGEHYKAWNCKERQKGKTSNGCKNSAVREEALLAEIAAALGMQEFDRSVFDTMVDRVFIGAEGMRVQLKNGNNHVTMETVGKTV